MENPEEVLQALDEFQKMRPTEIPRELEEYLCWVAKTGDPVYQWSLIKALFREKLTRVMTDFYESCPSLDLAPCPNVDIFNYDTMKSSLLERLESFANAPFTVQRICELLTAPRKEYNRIDKFMRAIEKNILVVSTKEPGSTIRRNENGDGLVNGSIEDDAPGGETHDVEMDSWVKDCAASTVGMSAQTMENEVRLLDDVTTTVTKGAPATNGSLLPQEKTEHENVSTCETSGLGFVPSTSDFSAQGSESRDSMSTGLGVQNLSTSIVLDSPSIAGEVPEAIMNEDTSSQPSLDIDSPENEQSDPNRKLQTTFQAKDFISHDSKSPEPYEKDTKVTEKPDEESEAVSEVPSVESSAESLAACEKLKPALDERESVLPNMKNFLQANSRLENSVATSEGAPNDQKPAPVPEIEGSDSLREKKNLEVKNSTSTDQDQLLANSTLEPQPTSSEDKIDVEPVVPTYTLISVTEEVSTKEETMQEVEKEKEHVVKELSEEFSEPVLDMVEETDARLEEPEIKRAVETPKPIVEESSSEKINRDDSSQDSENSSLTIEETTEDDSTETQSMVPDPIPIIEEPTEVKPNVKDCEKVSSIDEVESKTTDIPIENLPKNEPSIIKSVESAEVAISEEELPVRTDEPLETKTLVSEEKPVPELVPEVTIPEKETRPTESMEVDGEESATIFQGDEPMEEEVPEVVSS